MPARHEVHLRVLTSEDAGWTVELDDRDDVRYARDHGWDSEKLAAELDEGIWASDDRFAWAIVIDGEPGGFALVTGLSETDARMEIRIDADLRGRGVGREVLRQLADHHFAANPHLVRLAGRAHEHNVPMQRAFNAAGFRMEARYRDSFQQADGALASEWGYALTRADWEAGRHRGDEQGYDLHGLSFAVEETIDGAAAHGVLVKFLQEGRRAIARYDGPRDQRGRAGRDPRRRRPQLPLRPPRGRRRRRRPQQVRRRRPGPPPATRRRPARGGRRVGQHRRRRRRRRRPGRTPRRPALSAGPRSVTASDGQLP